MVYVDTPISTDDQDVSAPQMRGNFSQANTSFGTNHYAFNDLTANNGKHSVIQTPSQGSHPSTAAAEPAMYGMQDSANVGVIQYSRGPSDAVPSPITLLQSSSSTVSLPALGTLNVLNCTGLARGIFNLYAFAVGSGVITQNITVNGVIFWDGGNFSVTNVDKGNSLLGMNIIHTGNIIQISNLANVTRNIYWTMQMLRLS